MTEKGLKLIMDFEGLPKNKPLDAYWDKYAWEENNYDKYEDN